MSPSPFIVEWIRACHVDARVEPTERRRALDVAMGSGRHLLPIAHAGYLAFGVDVKLDAVHAAVEAAKTAGTSVRAWCADLTQHPLPRARFDLIVVCRYLQRDLFPSLQTATTAGGVVLYETFTTAQCALGTGPRSPEHLLEPGELRSRFDVPGWSVLFYEETRSPEAVARIAARRVA